MVFQEYERVWNRKSNFRFNYRYGCLLTLFPRFLVI